MPFMASTAVDADTIYGLTQALWHPSTGAALANGHARGTGIAVETALRGIAIPLHAGALRYYQEIGLVEASEAEVK